MKDKTNNSNPQEKNLTKPVEINGRGGLEPTRYGIETPEWEKNGRVSDF